MHKTKVLTAYNVVVLPFDFDNRKEADRVKV
jgi:hypothetical protein